MKKILLTVALATSIFVSKAQTALSENFDGTTGTGLPTGWTQSNVDGLTPDPALANLNFGTNAWISRVTSGTDRILTSTSYYAPIGTSNDWIISPQISIPTAGYWLVFEANSPDGQYLDGFQVKASTSGNAVANFSTNLLTVAAATTDYKYYAVDLSAYAGMNVYIAIVNNSNDKYLLNINNFIVKKLPAKDAAITTLGPSAETRASFAQVSGTGVTLNGTIQNFGSTTINSIDIKYFDGTSVVTDTKTGLNIAPYQTYNFTHATPVSFAAVGSKPITFWASLAGDAITTNDSAKTECFGYTTKPTYRIAFEEGTGTWCGWCPRGAVYMDSMEKVNGAATTLIAVHNGDPMVVSAYDAGIGGLIGGYPSAVASREAEIDPSEMFAYYNAHKNDFGYGDVEITAAIAGSTLTANGKFTPVANLKGNYRMAFVVTEDHVTGTTSTYNQANYYNNNQDLIGDGVNWKNLPNPVPAAQMKYDHVARYIADGFTGSPNTLPSPMTAGTPYSKSFSYTIPATSLGYRLKANLLIINQDNGFVANSKSVQLLLNTKDLVKELDGVTFFPNPANTAINFSFNMNQASDLNVVITNQLGQVVKEMQNISTTTGANQVTLDVHNLSNGIYNATIFTNSGKVSTTINVQH